MSELLNLISSIKNDNLDELKLLIESGVSIKSIDECVRTPLHFAESLEMRDFLRDKDPTAYSIWENEQELFNACERGDLDEVKRLVESGVSVKCRDKFGRKLFDFVKSDNIYEFLRNVDPLVYNVWVNEQFLIKACVACDLDKVKQLINAGVSVNCRNKKGRTPMFIAVLYGHKKVAEWLLSLGASVNDEDACGKKLFHLVVKSEMCGFLCTVAPASYRVWEKEQDLIYACGRGDLNEAKRLVDSGVSVKCRDKDALTALHHAVHGGHIEVCEWLLSSGVSVNTKDQYGDTALMVAVKRNMVEIARLLIDGGVDLNVKNKDGRTALMIAIYKSKQNIALLIIDKGRSFLKQQDNNGWTALKFAIRENNVEIVRLLIYGGSATDELDVRTVIDFARRDYNPEIVSLLSKQLNWLPRRGFMMFLATQSYLPAAPLADSMSRDEMYDFYHQLHNHETRPNTAVHSVFFMQELQRYIISFLGPD